MSTYKEMAMELARYNRWQNGVLYGLCDGLGDDARKADCGLFFGSLHSTLDHILHVDEVLLDFVESGNPPTAFEPNRQRFGEYDALRAARFAMDERIQSVMDDNTAPWFDAVFRFFSEALGRERAVPRALMISQMFNHQTHHRAQATSELHRRGLDYGITDMPYNPLSQFDPLPQV